MSDFTRLTPEENQRATVIMGMLQAIYPQQMQALAERVDAQVKEVGVTGDDAKTLTDFHMLHGASVIVQRIVEDANTNKGVSESNPIQLSLVTFVVW